MTNDSVILPTTTRRKKKRRYNVSCSGAFLLNDKLLLVKNGLLSEIEDVLLVGLHELVLLL